MLDMKDPATWYFLGNAYFSNFIANFKKFDQLENALKAYNQAVPIPSTQEQYFTSKYPDLFLNRSNVEYHMEHFEAALKDCQLAHEIDPEGGLGPNIKKIQDRMEFTRVNFLRAVLLPSFRTNSRRPKSKTSSTTSPTRSTTTKTTWK